MVVTYIPASQQGLRGKIYAVREECPLTSYTTVDCTFVVASEDADGCQDDGNMCWLGSLRFCDNGPIVYTSGEAQFINLSAQYGWWYKQYPYGNENGVLHMMLFDIDAVKNTFCGEHQPTVDAEYIWNVLHVKREPLVYMDGTVIWRDAARCTMRDACEEDEAIVSKGDVIPPVSV